MGPLCFCELQKVQFLVLMLSREFKFKYFCYNGVKFEGAVSMSLNHICILGMGLIALAGCSGRSVAVGQNRLDSLIPKTVALQTEQNTEISYDLNPSPSVFTDAQAEIVTAPQKGTVTFNGSTFEYQPDAYESGSDSFEYRLRSLGLTSSPAEVVVQIDPFVAGPYSYT